jgi:hypothetical protein
MKQLQPAELLSQLFIFLLTVTPILALKSAPFTESLSIQDPTPDTPGEWQGEISPRAPHTNAAESQVAQVLEVLASKSKNIPPSHASVKEVENELQKKLAAREKGKQRIEVFFIIYGGSNGDVPLLSSVLQGMLDRPDIYDVKHCIVMGDSFRDFFPAFLQKRFAADNSGWASRTNPPARKDAVALFVQKMTDILTKDNWNPDMIVGGHFIAPSAVSPEQSATIKKLTAPSTSRLLLELQVFYMPGLRATSLTVEDISPNHLRIYGQQPEIWAKSGPKDIGAAMVGKFPRLLSGGTTSSATSKASRTGDVYDWIDKQTVTIQGKQQKRRIFYMGLGMKERAFDKTNAFPAFMDVAQHELDEKSRWSFIIFHNAQKSESRFPRTTHGGRVFHLFVGETSWSTLFPEMTAVLVHGGVGSMTDAIAAGVPQIILPTDYAPDQDYFSRELQTKSLPIGVGLQKIPIADVNAGRTIGTKRIIAAFADVRKNLKQYSDNIKPYQTQLEETKAIDNTFAIIDRMCYALVAGGTTHDSTAHDSSKSPPSRPLRVRQNRRIKRTYSEEFSSDE